MTDDKTDGQLRQYREWFRVDKEHCRNWHEQAKEDFQFLAGEQWTDKEKEQLKAQLRPVVTFNRTHPIINSISGQEISNRQEVKYFPREEGDAKANEILTEGSKWFRDEADADDEDSDAFLDALTCGIGLTETYLDFEKNDAGQPDMDAVNPLEVLWDCNARKKNFTDRRRQWRVRRLPASVVLEMFPDAGREDIDASWATLDAREEPTDREQSRFYQSQESDETVKDDDLVTLVHLQYKKKVSKFLVVDMNGRSKLSKEEFGTYQKRAEMMGMPYAAQKVDGTEIRNVFIGGKVLQDTPALCPTHFSFQFVTAYMDRVSGLPYGLMRLMKDPQRWSNKWMSQALHILNSNAKGGLMAEEDAVEDFRALERDWSRPDRIVKFKPGALSAQKVQQKPTGQFPASFFQMMEFAIQSVRDVTGISVELLGMREANQAASLEYQRRQAGMIIVAPLFDNLKRYRREQGRLMLYIIQHYLNDGRLVRIVGEQGARYVPLAIDASAEYDIIVDEQVNSPDQKMMVWQSLVPLLPQLPPQIQLALIDYAPLPTSVIEKIKQAAQQIEQNQQPSPEVLKVQAEAEAKKSEQEFKAQELQQKEADSQRRFDIDRGKLILDAEKLRMDGVKNAMDAVNNIDNQEFEMQKQLTDRGLPPDYSADREMQVFSALAEQLGATREQTGAMLDVLSQQSSGVQTAIERFSQALDMFARASAAPKRVIKDANGSPVSIETVMN